MQQGLYIYGAGGFGREVRSMLSGLSLDFIGFIDDTKQGKDIIGDTEWLMKRNGAQIVLAVGNSSTREVMYSRISRGNFSFPSLIHNSVILQDKSSIAVGEGCVLTAGCIFTCNIEIGAFTIINLNTTVAHDVRIGRFVSIMPSVNIGGGVVLEDEVYLGTNATIMPFLRIGKGAVVGAGAVVTKDVPPGVTVKGVPAR